MILKIGTTGDYPPISCIDPETGEFIGTDIERAKKLAELLNREPVFVHTTWKTLCDDLEAEKFDIALSAITVTPERRRRAFVSVGYQNNGKTLICRAESAGRFKGLADIDRADVTVVENSGGTNEAFAKKYLPHCRLLVCENNADAPRQLLAGRADVMITDIVEAKYLASLYDEIAVPLCEHPFTDEKCCVLVGKHCKNLLDEINRWLAQGL